MTDNVYLRDLDGTGSLHACSKEDEGAIEFAPAAEVEYTEEQHYWAEQNQVLGAEYVETRGVVERFLFEWKEEHVAKLVEEAVEPVVEAVRRQLTEALEDHLLSDVQYNAHTKMKNTVTRSVNALIGGHKWATDHHILPEGREGAKVRETLARLHSDEIKSKRIEELEKELERMQKRLNECVRF